MTKKSFDLKEFNKLIYSNNVSEIKVTNDKPVVIEKKGKVVPLNHFIPPSNENIIDIIEELELKEKALKDYVIAENYRGNLLEVCVSPDKQDVLIRYKKIV